MSTYSDYQAFTFDEAKIVGRISDVVTEIPLDPQVELRTVIVEGKRWRMGDAYIQDSDRIRLTDISVKPLKGSKFMYTMLRADSGPAPEEFCGCDAHG